MVLEDGGVGPTIFCLDPGGPVRVRFKAKKSQDGRRRDHRRENQAAPRSGRIQRNRGVLFEAFLNVRFDAHQNALEQIDFSGGNPREDRLSRADDGLEEPPN